MPAAISGRSSAQSMCSPSPLSCAWILVMTTTVLRRRAAGSGRGSLAPPGPQPLGRLLLAQRPFVNTKVHEEVPGLADGPPRHEVEDLHDLVAVEVGTHGIELLLRPELGDTGLELVHTTGQGTGLGRVPRRAVATGELVERVEVRAGVADVTPYGLVRPPQPV